MTVDIVINQMGKPAGVAGESREDLDLGLPVDLSLSGGPFLQVFWSILDKPIDYTVPAQSIAALTNPSNPITQVTPIDYAGTYFIQVAVDAGFGLGARPEDISRRTFYAGPPLNPVYNLLPRRNPAFGERLEHNVPDGIFAQNPRGWAQELDRWLATLAAGAAGTNIFAGVRWDDTGAVIVAQKNVASVVPAGVGIYNVNFTANAPNADYLVLYGARGASGSQLCTFGEAVNAFQVHRADPFGVYQSGDFSLAVLVLLDP